MISDSTKDKESIQYYIKLSFEIPECQPLSTDQIQTDICFKDATFGAFLLIPIVITTIFTVPSWFKAEGTWKRRFCTLPLLVGQFWPQCQFIKVLWLMWQTKSAWKYEKERLEREIGSIGKSAFLNSYFMSRPLNLYKNQ